MSDTIQARADTYFNREVESTFGARSADLVEFAKREVRLELEACMKLCCKVKDDTLAKRDYAGTPKGNADQYDKIASGAEHCERSIRNRGRGR